MIRYATMADLASIKRLADGHKRELGFVLYPALKEAIDEGRVLMAVRPGKGVVGFIHFRHRRDRVTKVYHICIEGDSRRQGFGSALIAKLVEQAVVVGQSLISLCCPEDLFANGFYRAYGFTQGGLLTGRVRRLVQWTLNIGSDSGIVASESDI